MIKYILLVFLTIFLLMAIQTWGALQKSTSDDETIEQAIGRLISDHEADSSAHLGEGESLQNHKHEDVIDHPALSIVPDKFSNAQTFFDMNVNPYIADSATNCSGGGAPPFIYVSQASPLTSDGYYYIAEVDVLNSGYVDGDVIVDFIIYQTGSSGTKQGEVNFGFGKIQLKDGYYRIGYYTTSWQYGSWISATVSKPLRFRFYYNSTTNYLYVFLRDTQVASISYTLALEDDLVSSGLVVNRGTSSSMSFYITNFKIWFDGM